MRESNRQRRFGRLVQQELSEILQWEFPELPENAIVTVTGAKPSPDLRVVKVYLSAYPPEDKEDILGTLMEFNKEIRHMLAKRIAKQVRHIPELIFFEDDTLEYAEKMDKLFKKLHEEDEMGEDKHEDSDQEG